MPLDFPADRTELTPPGVGPLQTGDSFTSGGRTWVYNSSIPAWEPKPQVITSNDVTDATANPTAGTVVKRGVSGEAAFGNPSAKVTVSTNAVGYYNGFNYATISFSANALNGNYIVGFPLANGTLALTASTTGVPDKLAGGTISGSTTVASGTTWTYGDATAKTNHLTALGSGAAGRDLFAAVLHTGTDSTRKLMGLDTSDSPTFAGLSSSGDSYVTGVGKKVGTNVDASTFVTIFGGATLSIFQFPSSKKFGIQAAGSISENGGSASTYCQISFGSSKNTMFGALSANQTDPGYRVYVSGSFCIAPGIGTTVTPANNGDLVIEATSNTSVTIKLKGSDGTVRSVSLTLS